MSVKSYAARLLAEDPTATITLRIDAFADMIYMAAADEREECAKFLEAEAAHDGDPYCLMDALNLLAERLRAKEPSC